MGYRALVFFLCNCCVKLEPCCLCGTCGIPYPFRGSMWRCDPLAEVLFLEGHGVPIHLFWGLVLVLVRVMVMVCICFPMVGSCSASWLMCTTCVCTCGGVGLVGWLVVWLL